jgi:hypothetical protein
MPRTTAIRSGAALTLLAVLAAGAYGADVDAGAKGPALALPPVMPPAPAMTPAILPAPPAPAPQAWRASGGPAAGGSYRWLLSRGAFDFGLRFEPQLLAPLPIDARFDSVAPLVADLPSLSFGLTEVAAGPASASSLIERALGGSAGVPYVRKIGIEWKPAQSQVFFHQGLGVRLSGDDRLTMRLRKGSLGIYMQRNF